MLCSRVKQSRVYRVEYIRFFGLSVCRMYPPVAIEGFLVLSRSMHSRRSLSTLVWSIRREYHSMEQRRAGARQATSQNSRKARYPLSATVCPVRRRLQRSFFAAGPHKFVSPIGVNQEGDTGQYCTLGSNVRNVVQYEEYVLHEVVLAATCLIKPQGTHESRPRWFPSSLLHVMYSFALWAARFNLQTFLVKYHRGVDYKWQGPPRYEHGAGQG